MTFESQQDHGCRVTVEIEIDESLTLFAGYTMGEGDDIPRWLHGEIVKRMSEVKQLVMDGWDGETEGADDPSRG